MFLAMNESGERVVATKGASAQCPGCKAEVVAKCGEIVSHHWAHRSSEDCDKWYEPESEWHLSMKRTIAIDNDHIEVVIGPHRADVVANNSHRTVVELQHSGISVEEIWEREKFYKNMIWIFDQREAYEDERIYKDFSNDHENFYRWVSPRRSVYYCRSPVILALSDEYFINIDHIFDSGYMWGRKFTIHNLKAFSQGRPFSIPFSSMVTHWNIKDKPLVLKSRILTDHHRTLPNGDHITVVVK
jgi:competence CoiA-like predicted nuclease